jgi:hypothetical protein
MTQPEARKPDEIEREIRRTQQDMSETVNRIGDQLTPRSVINALLDKADERGVDARWLLDGARRNPLALGLISAGAIWLVSDYDANPSAFTSGKGRSAGERSTDHPADLDYDSDHRGYVEHMSRCERLPGEDEIAYQRRRDEHRGTYFMMERDHAEDHSSYRRRLDDAASRMREKRDRFADAAREKRQDVARRGRQAARKGQQAYYDNPVLGGVLAALVGAAFGSALPVSQPEREHLGRQGARAIDEAKAKARELGDKARRKKDEALETMDHRLQQGGQQPSVPPN